MPRRLSGPILKAAGSTTRKEAIGMFRYADGWMWFLSGLALTLAFAALAVVLARLGDRAHVRRR